MDSWIDLHPSCRRILSGHRAMTPLTEEDEDAPEEISTPITGLPEPIPGFAYWEKTETISPDTSSEESDTGSDHDESIDDNKSLWNFSVSSLSSPKISSGLCMGGLNENCRTRFTEHRYRNVHLEAKFIEPNKMDLHPSCRRILSGHRAMTPLTEEDEDAPVEIPTPITGSPEPIPGSAYWEKTETISPDTSSEESDTRSDHDESMTSPKISYGLCLDGLNENLRSHFTELRSRNAHLEEKVIDLNKYIDHMNGDYDNCMNRVVYLEEKLEMAQEEIEFYRKLLETIKHKGMDKTFAGTSLLPVVDPEVKSLVDERLAFISRSQTPEAMAKSPILENIKHKVGSKMSLESPVESGIKADILRIEHVITSPTEENEKFDVASMESLKQLSVCEMDISNIQDQKNSEDLTLELMLGSPENLQRTQNNTSDINVAFTGVSMSTKQDILKISDGEIETTDQALSKENSDCHLITPSIQKSQRGSRNSRTPKSQKNTPRAQSSQPLGNLKGSAAVRATSLDDLTIEDAISQIKMNEKRSHVDQRLVDVKLIDNVINNNHQQSSFMGNYDLGKIESQEKDSKYVVKIEKCLELPPLKKPIHGYNKLPQLGKEPYIPCTSEQHTVDEYASKKRNIRDLDDEPKETPCDKSQFLLDLGLVAKEHKTVQPTERKVMSSARQKHREEKSSSIRLSKRLKSLSEKDDLGAMKRTGISPSKKPQNCSLKRNSVPLPTVTRKTKEDPKIGIGMEGLVLPKIKTIASDTQKGNLVKKLKVAPLPNLLKVTPTPPKVFLPKPRTVQQSKRPFIGKSRQLPSIVDLFVDFEKGKN